MAELHELSSILQNLKDSYDSIVATKSVQSDIITQLNEVNTSLDAAISAYSSAGSDSQITSLVSSVGIIKGGVSAVISHTQGDLDGLYSNLDEVKASVIDRVDELHDLCASEGWKEAATEIVEDPKTGQKKEEYKQNDQAKIDQANAEIDMLNQKGEAQLNAISAAINGVSFGVIGNMVTGGGVVSGVNYLDNYSFDASEFVIETEGEQQGDQEGEQQGDQQGDQQGEQQGDQQGDQEGEQQGDQQGDQQADQVQQVETNTASKVASAVVGVAEGVVNLGEGVVDAAGTAASWLLDKIGDLTGSQWCKQASSDVKDFVQNDYSRMAGDTAMGALSSLTGGAIQNDESWRSGANVVGEVATAVLVPAIGLKTVAASAMGQTSETVLGAGGNIDQATLSGGLAAGGSYILGKVGQKILGKVANTKVGGKVVSKLANTRLGKGLGLGKYVAGTAATAAAATAATAATTAATTTTTAAAPAVATTTAAAAPAVATTAAAAAPAAVTAAAPAVVTGAAPAVVTTGTNVASAVVPAVGAAAALGSRVP